MGRTCLAVCAVYLIAASILPLQPAYAGTPDTKAGPERGIAVLASSIGSDVTPEGLAEFVQQGKFSPVVVDWAWITYHWDRTDFAALNRFLELMTARKVPVAAMYRPRFLSNPTEATQIGKDGKRVVDHAEICYSDPSARKWGISWGEKILEKCPSLREVIIYNPLNQCRCPKCADASKRGSHSAVMGFLSEARSAWRAKQPEVKLGVVYMPVPEFWKAGLAVVDVAHPYLRIKEDVDAAKDVANIQTVRSIVKEKMGSCLGKITWEEGAKVSIEKLKMVDDLAGKSGISYSFWTFDTLFKSSLYDPKAVAQALGIDPSAIAKISGEMNGQTANVAAQPAPAASKPRTNPSDGLMYTPEQIRSTSAETFLERMQNLEPGYWQFAALNALAQKAKEADAETRRPILSLVITAMKDKSRTEYQRFQCCYVISGCGDEQGVPDLIEVLLNDKSETMRSVAAEALAGFPKSAAAHDALLQAARQETSPKVREVLTRRLGQAMPALEPVSAPAAAGGVEELAPSGPPKPPPGPARPVTKPLPWPFSGDSKAQHIFNNYQQATDSYIHGGLDFIQPAGTPVTAVGPGYVAAIFTNYPDWTTHYCFIVTPKKGGDRGWCYTHMDPQTFTFKEGDSIQQGQLLGKLVKFSVGDKPGVDHLHLHYVTFTKDASGKVDVHSLLDPLYFFDWKDTVPPAFRPLWFVTEGTTQQFQADSSGVITVSGKVDILAAITDSAYPGHMGNLGVPVVMLSISDGTHTMQKLVLDHRGDVGDEKRQTKPLYLSHEERKALLNPDSFPRYQVLRVAKTDGDGKITPQDGNECWDTTARDGTGDPIWPDGQYSVNVYAWDIAGNRAVVGAAVQVRNKLGEAASSAPAQAAQSASQPGDSSHTPDDTKRTSAEPLLERMQHAEPGAAQFAAIDDFAQKVKESDAAGRTAMLSLLIATMKNKSLEVPLRWPCCYVISRSGDERGVPDLIQVLLHDESETMRAVAAEALGGLSKNAAAHDALLQAARKETNQWVRETLTRYLGQGMPAPELSSTPAAARAVEELAPSGPPKPPPGPARPVTKPLPWPFPGDYKAQSIFNNYQTALDEYIHCGLDFIHPAGTPVTAVGPGYVAAIWTHEPHTGDFFIVTIAKGANKGWCYTHMDPQTFTFKEGDSIEQGQLLGKLVKFSVGDKPGMDHLHLHYVTFTEDASGKITSHSLLDPLYFFDWKDTVPPAFLPLWFVPEGATRQFQADSSGVVTVNGKVDILAAITDSAYPGQESLLGVPVVMVSISDGTHTMQKLALDQRGDVGDEKQVKPLYLSREESRALTNPNSWFPYYQVLRVTKTDGDGKIEPKDATECWDTTALDSAGRPLWPDGRYSVNVYAWDTAGNRAVVGATVQVKNEPGAR
jgi:murein DD-endopeptidase MepM/ murein hydrolase activator NlpD